ncbi:zinc-binding protein A33-like [Lacerta agilis]|uniref:zinc-binding protein A33-like n=1 Tax=Lacerta agilis TaxID=80427 RepID=UPI001419DB31|nr:zinc-binding protein A33-like [Lacerta agilis]
MESPTAGADSGKEAEEVVQNALGLHEEAEKLSSGYKEKIQITLKALHCFQEKVATGFKELHDFLYDEESSLMAKIDREEEKHLCFLENKLMDVAEAASSALELADNLSVADNTSGNYMRMTEIRLEQLRMQVAKHSREMRFCGPDVLCSPPLKYSICRQMLKRAAHCALQDLTLDDSSAHPHLIVSADLKSVKLSPRCQAVPNSLWRFQPCLYVLCSQGFQSGKHYWEVSVGQKTNWVLGVASCRVNRKAVENLTPENGYWVLKKAPGDHFYALSSTPVLLAPSHSPSKVGVLLDYENGKVGFYSAENMVKICTVTGDFQEMLHPFFCPGLTLAEEDCYPLTINS